MTHRVAAVVLAAGLSSRMAPANKLLAKMGDGATMIAHSVRHVLASGASPVMVVTGFQAPLIEAALAGLPVGRVHAADYAEGMAASLRAGVAALPEDAEAVLIMLGDMPLVEPALIVRLLGAYDPGSGQDIVVPVWRGQRGNPRIFGRRYFEALQALAGDSGAKRLLDVYSDRVFEVDSAGDEVLRDFDTLDALEMLRLG